MESRSKRASPPPAFYQKAQNEIKTLKAELAEEKKKVLPETSLISRETGITKTATAPPNHKAKTTTTTKGASLANPNKKARKYQAVEFDGE